MKQIYKKNYVKDMWIQLKWALIVLVYYSTILFFTLINILISDNIHDKFTFNYIVENPWYIFFVFIAPLLTSLSHILYKEKGWIFCRLMLWLITFFLVISIPVVSFFII